jgi:hypothetical protein
MNIGCLVVVVIRLISKHICYKNYRYLIFFFRIYKMEYSRSEEKERGRERGGLIGTIEKKRIQK